MEQLERTVVQTWEAKRLAARGGIPRERLALLLLDNAAYHRDTSERTYLGQLRKSALLLPGNTYPGSGPGQRHTQLPRSGPLRDVAP